MITLFASVAFKMTEYDLYKSGMSIPQVSDETGIPMSTLRFRFKKAGILRGRTDGVRIAARDGRLGSGLRGKKRVFTKEWRKRISDSKSGAGKGHSVKPSGYVEITMGENKGRLQHVVIMEESIGRRLYANECVHHVNMDRSDNRIENLCLMTRSEHARLHALERVNLRERNEKGEFK